MPAGSYLAVLLISLLGIWLLDRRHKLAFFFDAKRSFIALIPAYLGFLIWDLIGISQGIFFRGTGSALVGINIAPELPIEELFFLALLCYSTLVIIRLVEKRLKRS